MLYKIMIKLCFCALLICMMSCVNTPKGPHSIRYEYGKLFNIAYTPEANTRCGGWFTDQGSWMGFTIPMQDKWINGFCGPFSLDHRHWMVRSAVVPGFSNINETFTPDSTNYFPGEIFVKSHSPSGNIEQHLQFIDTNTALLYIRTNINRELQLKGDTWANGTSFKLNQNTVIARHPSGEIVCIGFEPDARVSITNDNYLAVCSGENVYVTLSFFNNEKEKIAGLQKATSILNHPQNYIEANNKRWEGYLTSVLRNDMPEEYNRIAVKAVATLIANWQSQKGGLLHEGVVPSHAVGYFMGFWAWDSWKTAVAYARFAPEVAKNQIRAMFDYQLADGMVIDCIYSNTDENNARDSKPPLAAWAVDEIFTHTNDTAFVREMYPQLLAYHRWWYAKRDHNRNGICEFGSVDGTAEAAAWESGMDNAIRFDNAKMVKNADDAWSFDQESVDLNAYLAYEYKLLKKFAGLINQPFAEPDYTANVAEYFFDSTTGFFFDRHLPDGEFIKEEGCEAYIPFWTGIASKEQMNRALPLLTDTTKFATYIPFPTVAADNPKFTPKGYWRGPIWLDQTYFAIKGLRNYGHKELADKFTGQVFNRLHGLKEDAPIHENYGTHTGELLKAPHFGWSSAHLLLMYEEFGK
ncbi:trehalase family glycosidase [Bacteroides sp. 519]|uniref:MGH1-like glycoside hydrolase domain-containing protein n=1 Tax=Bacteroides sp. 519 TaxID=2302937 RepID=UPI0013CF987A|nr:glycoside hydrolase [Bacteroides sp. 519]